MGGSPAVEICDNGIDDDGNGDADCADPTCRMSPICLQANTEVNCVDGIDNDHDTLVDCSDPDCSMAAACIPPSEAGDCTDMIDNDGDGFTDCDDPDCDADVACGPPGPQAFTTEQIQARMTTDCSRCHGARWGNNFVVSGAGAGPNGLRLIQNGDHTRSYVWLKLAGMQGAGNGSRMPLGGPFWSVDDLDRFAAWIDSQPAP